MDIHYQRSSSGNSGGGETARFYSQGGEDYLLWRFFAEKTAGFYVDIGAFDGIHLSNSYTFERIGWKGICVEPNPEIFFYCMQNRPGTLCLNQACVASPEQAAVKLYVETLGLLSSTIGSQEKLQDIKNRYSQRGLDFPGLKEIRVKANTVDGILDEHFPELKKIDFISIDTEGNEIDVIRGIDFNRVDTRVVLVEANSQETQQELSRLLKEKGNYQPVRRVKANLFFVKSDEDLEKMKRIRLNCTIEKQMHPLGPRYTRPKFMKGKIIRE
jgi:FkbM family methyltransferase